MAVVSYFVKRYRGAIAALGFGVRSSLSQPDSAVPTITSGTGVPTTTPAPGSLFLRTDAPDADNSLYQRVGGAWVTIKGATA